MAFPTGFTPLMYGDRPHHLVLFHNQGARLTTVSCRCGARLGSVPPEDGPEPCRKLLAEHLAEIERTESHV